jgi:hypothetical protein
MRRRRIDITLFMDRERRARGERALVLARAVGKTTTRSLGPAIVEPPLDER